MLSQALLYVCFAVLAGSFILMLVPNNLRPEIKIPKNLLLISGGTLPIFAFFPVLDITLFIAPRLGLIESFKLVLTTYTVGTAWNFTLLGSVVLVLLITMTRETEKSSFAYAGTFLTLGLMLTVAWSSHAGSIDPTMGFISHFLHLTAVSVWVGILLIIGWCAVNHQHWLPFLSWFSAVAIGCLAAAVLSGVLLMEVMVDGYINSWMVSYGQGLLIKHLFLVPLLFYALVNGVIVKYKLSKDAAFNPVPWIRVEGFILLAIFTITAAFTQQSPPHGNVSSDAISPLFNLFHGGIIEPGTTIGFVVNVYTVGFFFLSILLFSLLILSFFKKAAILLSFLLSCFLVASIYIMLMVTVVIR